jgi:hypothetical protein
VPQSARSRDQAFKIPQVFEAFDLNTAIFTGSTTRSRPSDLISFAVIHPFMESIVPPVAAVADRGSDDLEERHRT